MDQNGELTVYQDLFVQPQDRYGLKRRGWDDWIILKSDDTPYKTYHTENHLNGEYAIASLGKWYPNHAAFDIDGKDIKHIDEIREKLHLNIDNHFLMESETPGNYHILFRPTYNQKPPTVRLLNEIMSPFAAEHGIEAYPQVNKPFRLPFSPIQKIVDENLYFVDEWEAKLYWFLKLDEYDLKEIPKHQQLIPFEYPHSECYVGAKRSGKELFIYGLQQPSSRNQAQFEVLYYLWRSNVPLESAIETCYQWILRKHNGYSEDIRLKRFRIIRGEIRRQASRIYSHYSFPDQTHVSYTGFITKEDIPVIFYHSGGSIPRAKFLFHLVKYYYPRKLKKWVEVHSDKLVEWSSYTNYMKRLRYFEDREILRRNDFYITGVRSKSVILKWNFHSIEKAIMVDDRSPETFEDTIREAMPPEEARKIMLAVGFKRSTVSMFLKKVYSEGKFVQ